MSKSTQNFGRNEMAALFGGLPDDNDDLASSKNQSGSHLLLANKSSGTSTAGEIDYSKLTAAQAAALLKSKANTKKTAGLGGGSLQQQRHRATKKKNTPTYCLG
mmetsp:Transcript_23309/g.32667  ORF Transcript_23309/g.32667 Transcript_23309/m.32667 type:complete len:104 (-) Transcript_23309:54-365(-)